MCLILFGYKAHPKYKLVVIANRDEFYERPTEQANWWETFPNMLAGRDLKGNGSWFGVNKEGRFAALTNYRDGMQLKQNAPTRGTLVTDFLVKNELKPIPYLESLDEVAEDYNGYNLLLWDADKMYHYSNMERKIQKLNAGVYGLSNHLLNTSWPKVEKGKTALSELLEQPEFSVEAAFKALQNAERPADKDLPNTGVPLKWERLLSSMCIQADGYGTRCSTVLLMDYENNVYFEERSYVPKNDAKVFEYEITP